VVVTRWFGGTKLGTGGLVRAYGGAAGQALDRAERTRLVVMERLSIEHPYECSGAVTGLLAAWRLEPLEADYGGVVRLVLEVPEERRDEFVRELTDRTSGRAEVSGGDER
jgi:putative IMPACT (imprinted ancient) family translation regulator